MASVRWLPRSNVGIATAASPQTILSSASVVSRRVSGKAMTHARIPEIQHSHLQESGVPVACTVTLDIGWLLVLAPADLQLEVINNALAVSGPRPGCA